MNITDDTLSFEVGGDLTILAASEPGVTGFTYEAMTGYELLEPKDREYVQFGGYQKGSGGVIGRYVKRESAEVLARWLVTHLGLDLSDMFKKDDVPPELELFQLHPLEDKTPIFEVGGEPFYDRGVFSELEVFQEGDQFGFLVKGRDGEPKALRWLDERDARSLAFELLDRTDGYADEDSGNDSRVVDPLELVQKAAAAFPDRAITMLASPDGNVELRIHIA